MLWPKDTDETVDLSPVLLANVEEFLVHNPRKGLVPVDRRFLVALVKRVRELERERAATDDALEQARDEGWSLTP